MIIETSEELAKECMKASVKDYIAFDTEFSRQKGVYYPIPSLIQFSYDGSSVVICDMLKKLDWQPLIQIFTNDRVEKVFHSIKQDLDVIYKLFGIKPKNIFDVQIAAMFLGDYNVPSYDLLVKDFLYEKVDKSLQFSNWMARPLSHAQIEYAKKDVTYLYHLMPKIKTKLGDLKFNWFQDEMNAILEYDLNQNVQSILNKTLFRLINLKKRITPRYIWILEFIIRWREEYALKNDKIRNAIIDSNAICDFAYSIEIHFGEWQKLSKGKIKRQIIHGLKVELEKNDTIDFSEYEKLIELSLKKRRIMCANPEIYLSLKTLLQKCSIASGIHPSIICGKSDIIDIIIKQSLDTKLNSGWRYEVFGRYALELLQ